MFAPINLALLLDLTRHRAYIAASRRSDRSLEARVESARRASEIHKKRTGRSLRVTEQDVVNEEMYEEEDDDLPMQYRRLTAHLQTTNADFDRRLAAYLTNHVAMRTALGAAVSDNYVHPQYTNAPQFANQMSQYPQQPQFANAMPPPSMANRSPTSFRQSPYPTSGMQGYRQNLHNRAASIATPQELQGFQQNNFASPQSPVNSFKPEDRRMSLPVQGMAPQTQAQPMVSPGISRTSSSTSLANLKHEAKQQSNSPPNKAARPQLQPLQMPSMQQQRPSSSHIDANAFPNPFAFSGMPFGGAMQAPFTTALPMESQQLLGPGLDPNDPFTAMLLGNQEYKPQHSFYSYNPNGSSKTKGYSPPSNFDGMNQTLAPGVLDANYNDPSSFGTPMSAADSAMTPQSGFGGFGFDSGYADVFKAGSANGLTTPGEHDWASLIDANVWEEPSSQQTAA